MHLFKSFFKPESLHSENIVLINHDYINVGRSSFLEILKAAFN